MTEFIHIDPRPDAYWRAIVLFGRNSASYKFALAKTLLESAEAQRTEIAIKDLAEPFSRHICEHLKQEDRQGTSSGSKFLAACRKHNENELSSTELNDVTVQFGFQNVIDAFHVVGSGDVACRFFEDDRKGGDRIVLTDDLLTLVGEPEASSFALETEARWRLVETAWKQGIAASLLDIVPDENLQRFVVMAGDGRHRVDVTSSRDALNGYQRGLCFYCFQSISLDMSSPRATEVDHFYPHSLGQQQQIYANVNLDGVWNLVLTCQKCNRGKSNHLPRLNYLYRLKRRNDYLIDSHHPLRETLIRQTGQTEKERDKFLQEMDKVAVEVLGVSVSRRWEARETSSTEGQF
jgi:5-methylcytosine-specific restriction endonuclease McrA